MRLEWTINTTRGPAVGGTNVRDREAACLALERALQGTFGSRWGQHHATGVRAVCAELRAARLPFTYRSTAFVVTLDT